jgi:hypothetical protein
MGRESEGGGEEKRRAGRRNGGARTLMTTEADGDWPRKRKCVEKAEGALARGGRCQGFCVSILLAAVQL